MNKDVAPVHSKNIERLLIRARVIRREKGPDSPEYSEIAEKILRGMLDEVRAVSSK
jgi:hypothetical protein